MANSNFVLTCTTALDGASTAAEMAVGVAGSAMTTGAGASESIRSIADFITDMLGGSGISIIYTDTAVAATATVTFTGRPTAAETMLLGNVTITARNSGASGNEFNTSATDVAVTAAALAALINTSASFTGICTATSSAGVVTITAAVPGVIGNGLQISESLTNTTATAFASGAESHRSTFAMGV